MLMFPCPLQVMAVHIQPVGVSGCSAAAAGQYTQQRGPHTLPGLPLRPVAQPLTYTGYVSALYLLYSIA